MTTVAAAATDSASRPGAHEADAAALAYQRARQAHWDGVAHDWGARLGLGSAYQRRLGEM